MSAKMLFGFSQIARCLVLIVALPLAACVVIPEGQDTKLETDASKALVIVGYGFTGPPLKSFFGSRCPIKHTLGYSDTLVVDIVRLKPNPTGLFDSISASEGRCASMTPDEPVGYNFLYLPPGLYAITGLMPFGRISFRSDQIKYHLLLPRKKSFQVMAGDVVYLGDIIAHDNSALRSPNIPEGLPTFLELTRSDAAAKAALAKRDGPADKFRFLPFLQ